MPTISTCPNCRQQVSIPAGVDSAAAVRCPLCDAEYPLCEALVLAPPELVPVIAVMSQPSAAAEDEGAPPVVTLPFAGAATFGKSAAELNEATAVAERIPATAHLRRRTKSPLRPLVGVVVGGLAGCLVAYYVLLPWILGLTAPAGKCRATEKSAVEKVVRPDAAAPESTPVPK